MGNIRIYCVLVFVFLVSSANAEAPKERRPRNREVSPNYIYKRLRKLEDKYEKSQQDLEKILERIDAAKGLFSDDPECPKIPGFVEAPGLKKCYHLEPRDVFMNWTEADSTCQQLHPKAHLVSIESSDEEAYLKAKWKNERGISTISRFWTSAKLMPNGRWKWRTTNEEFKHSNWIPTSTHIDERFECMAVHSSEAFYWGDVACWAPHMVTCEIQL